MSGNDNIIDMMSKGVPLHRKLTMQEIGEAQVAQIQMAIQQLQIIAQQLWQKNSRETIYLAEAEDAKLIQAVLNRADGQKPGSVIVISPEEARAFFKARTL